MTVGINAIKEIFANCPFAATEELLRDLAEVCIQFYFVFVYFNIYSTKRTKTRTFPCPQELSLLYSVLSILNFWPDVTEGDQMMAKTRKSTF